LTVLTSGNLDQNKPHIQFHSKHNLPEFHWHQH